METTINKIEEELFCLNFELKAISDLIVYGKAERWVNGFMSPSVESEHLDRYNFITKYVKNKTVLDIACGCGYGSYLISKYGMANEVCGVDIDEDSIRYGNHRYSCDRIKRFVSNALNFSHNKKFDVIVSFETIEHIKEFEDLILKFYDLLEQNGLLFISTPITYKSTTTPANKFHEIEWNFFDFHNLFSKKFKIEEIYLQNVFFKKNKATFTHRIINKISRIFIKQDFYKDVKHGKHFEKYNNQYDMSNCVSGYQLLVLSKK